MRILQVLPFFSPSFGGPPHVVYQISAGLSTLGHDVTVLAGDYGVNKATFPPASFNRILLPSVISRWGFYFTPGIILWCKNHISDYDVVHLHEARTYQNLIVRKFATREQIPFVLSAHGTLPIIVQRQHFKRIYDLLFGRSNLAKANYLVAVSPAEVKQYHLAGIDSSRIRLIYNGINLQEFIYLPPKGRFRERYPTMIANRKVILYLGRLHRSKKINHIIESLIELKKYRDDFILVIIGPDDGEKKILQSLVIQSQLQEQVMFIGPIYGQDKLAALQDADVLAYPATIEIFGLVTFEALMCGTPVVVCDDSGSGQLINQAQAGYTIPSGDVKKLADALLHVLENQEEAQQKVIAGQKFIREQLDWEKIAGQLENLYVDCINQK